MSKILDDKGNAPPPPPMKIPTLDVASYEDQTQFLFVLQIIVNALVDAENKRIEAEAERAVTRKKIILNERFGG